jgi:hypothetical protein
MYIKHAARWVTAGIALVVMFSLGPVLPASAVSAKPASPITTMGVGWHNEVRVARTLYQCPGFNCNQGQAYPGNDLAEVCTLYANGLTWGLVFNRANLHTGFIPIGQLIYADPPQSCTNVGHGRIMNFEPTLYQCPAFNCNRGEVRFGHDVAMICVFAWPNNERWTWALNHANNHEGFIFHDQDPSVPIC